MLNIFGWLLLGVAGAWSLALYRQSHLKRLHLNYYAVYLLLSDDIRSHQKQGFEQWIRGHDTLDANALSHAAFLALENEADKLAAGDPKNPGTSSLLGARALIWKCKSRDS